MTDALREALQELVDAWDGGINTRPSEWHKALKRARTALQEPAPAVAREPVDKTPLSERVTGKPPPTPDTFPPGHPARQAPVVQPEPVTTECTCTADRLGGEHAKHCPWRAQAPVEPAPDSYAIALHSDGTTTDMRAYGEGYEAGKAAAPSQLVEDARRSAIAECLRAAMGVSVTDDSRRTADRIYVAIRAMDAKGAES